MIYVRYKELSISYMDPFHIYIVLLIDSNNSYSKFPGLWSRTVEHIAIMNRDRMYWGIDK